MTEPMEIWRFPNGEIVKVHPDFYPASCDHCGWQGSSEAGDLAVRLDAPDPDEHNLGKGEGERTVVNG